MLLFISDLHLSGKRPALTSLFVDFLGWAAERQPDLYILGDLFDAWIGDDAPDPSMTATIDAMKHFTQSGANLYLMHGNRDFLLGEHFGETTGTRLLDDPTLLSIDGEPVLLCHGDTLCTDDVDYQQFRSQVRDPRFVEQFLAKPLAERLAIAQQLRDESQKATTEKTTDIMDVNSQAVASLMNSHRVSTLIHGHTHRLAEHHLTLNGRQARRIVLGDWRDTEGNFLQVENGTFRLMTYPGLAPVTH